MDSLRRVSELLARTTGRRRLFGRGAEVAFGALIGVAAGSLTREGVSAGVGTVCFFPGPPCPCDGCQASGVCAKPCIIMTQFYASGCWVTQSITCCDCDCNGRVPGFPAFEVCGCGSDYHNNLTYCPDGNAG